MRALIFGILPFCLFSIWARWYYVCKINLACGDAPPTEEIIDKDRPTTLDIIDETDNSTLFSDYEQWQFGTGNHLPNLSDNNSELLDSIADYLDKHPDKNLTITGKYLEKEKDIEYSFFENLGQARGAEVRSLLEDRGIDEDRVTIDYDFVAGEDMDEPIGFTTFSNNGTLTTDNSGNSGNGASNSNGAGNNSNNGSGNNNPSNGGFTKMKFTFTDMTFSDANFENNSAEFRPGNQFILYADSVKTYLTRNPNQTLTIIGHTSSPGNDLYNESLGMKRANNAKAYFKKLGVNSSIRTLSMGEKQPVAPNDTEENQQKNRRVNFKIE